MGITLTARNREPSALLKGRPKSDMRRRPGASGRNSGASLPLKRQKRGRIFGNLGGTTEQSSSHIFSGIEGFFCFPPKVKQVNYLKGLI